MFMLFTVLNITAVKADIINEFVQVQCLRDLNLLKIDAFNANGDIAMERSEQNQEVLWDQHRIRNINTMIDYIQLIDNDGKPSNDYRDTRMEVKDPIQTSCTLIEELEDGTPKPQTYDIHIQPYFFNVNPNGECGGAQTLELTLKSKGRVFIDKLRYISECADTKWARHNEGTALGAIQSVSLNPEDGYISLEGGLGKAYEEDFVFTDIFWLDDDLPITHEKVYGNKRENK